MDEDFDSIDLSLDAFASEERAERRDAAENRKRILLVARQLFDERGVANVHMAALAEAAGVGKGTLYRRFANKGDLCQSLLHDQLVEHQEAMLDQLRRLHLEGESYLARLQYFLRQVVAFAERHVPLLREVQREGVMSGEEGDAPFFQWQRMTVQGLLRAAAEAGEVDPAVDLDVTVDLLLAPLTASFLSYLRQEQGYSTERIGRALSDLVERLERPSEPT